jgi:hypothetical protein
MQNTAKTEPTIRPTPHPGQRCVTVPLLLRSFRTLSGVAVLPAGAGSLPTELLLLSLPSPRPLRPPPQQLLLQPLWSEGILLVAVVAAHHLTAEDLECHLSTPMARCASRGQRNGCEGAQRAGSAQETVPRALPGSAAVIGCFSHQPDALTCHPRRAQPARPAAESVPNAATTRRWPAVMTPRDGGLRACDLVASHRAADGPGPSIEGARTHARCISRGAVAAVTCEKRACWIYLDLRPRPSAY